METELAEKERKERDFWNAQKAETDKAAAMWIGIRSMLLAAGCPIRATVVDEWFEERIRKAI